MQGEQQEDIETGDDDGPEQGNVKHEVERDGAAEHFREIAGADGHFAKKPHWPARPARIPIAAALGQVFAGDDPEPRGDDLHENGHQAGEADHPQQPVFELRAGGQVCAPIAGVHVTDADENGRADECPPFLPETGLMMRHRHGAMHPLQRHGRRAATGRRQPRNRSWNVARRVAVRAGFIQLFHHFPLRPEQGSM